MKTKLSEAEERIKLYESQGVISSSVSPERDVSAPLINLESPVPPANPRHGLPTSPSPTPTDPNKVLMICAMNYRIARNFRGIQFSRKGCMQRFCDLIFESSENVRLGLYFADLIFMVCQSTAKIGSLEISGYTVLC